MECASPFAVSTYSLISAQFSSKAAASAMLCHVSMQGIERPASVISRCAAFAIAGSKMLVFSESFRLVYVVYLYSGKAAVLRDLAEILPCVVVPPEGGK